MAHPGGRPQAFKTPEELQEKIDDYFRKHPEKATITGLINHCGLINRASFYDYEKRPEFSNTLKKARSRIEEGYENRLHEHACTGAIFALKNFGWKDKQDINLNATVNVNKLIEEAEKRVDESA
jgi:hypothetical protein